MNRQQKAARRLLKTIVAEFKGRGCLVCGESNFCCLSAHHLDPRKKRFTIGASYRKCVSPDYLRSELRGCVCTCLNCHQKIHAGLIVLDLRK